MNLCFFSHFALTSFSCISPRFKEINAGEFGCKCTEVFNKNYIVRIDESALMPDDA